MQSNPIRLHSTLGYRSPIDYEKITNSSSAAPASPALDTRRRSGERQLDGGRVSNGEPPVLIVRGPF
jgi:hypothetical protein